MPFQKGDKFWSKKPKRTSMKQAKPPPKKTKGKGKAVVAEPSEAMNLKSATHLQR